MNQELKRRPRSRIIVFRLTEEQYNLVCAAHAASHDATLSDFLRRVLLRDAANEALHAENPA